MKFSENYIAYLKQYGSITVNGNVMYGLGCSEDDACHLYKGLELLKSKPNYQEDYLPLYQDGADFTVYSNKGDRVMTLLGDTDKVKLFSVDPDVYAQWMIERWEK